MTITPADVARTLGVNAATVRRLRARAGVPPRKRGQGYTEEECAQLRAQLRYQPRVRSTANREQLRASACAQSGAQDEVNQLKGRITDLESRVVGLEALLTSALTTPWSVRTAGVSDSPAPFPAFSSAAVQASTKTQGVRLRLPTREPRKPPR
jgi:hypothetical protein